MISLAAAIETAGAVCVGGSAGWLFASALAAGAVSKRAGLLLLGVVVVGFALGASGAFWLGSLTAARP